MIPEKCQNNHLFITNVVGFLDVTTQLAQFLLVDIPI